MRSVPVRGGDRAVAAVFVLVIVAFLIFDASHAWFWQRAHDTAPVAGVVLLLLSVALLRRRRFAWWFFVLATIVGLGTWVSQRLMHHQTSGTWVGVVFGLAELGLLVSPAMRRYVGVTKR